MTDANIWISLVEKGGLLKETFSLPYLWQSTDLVLDELGEPLKSDLKKNGVTETALSPGEISQVVPVVIQYKALSVVDASALISARTQGLPLLTGDKNLREAAENESMSVRGANFVLGEMVTHQILTRRQADKALVRMRLAGCRIPDIRPWNDP